MKDELNIEDLIERSLNNDRIAQNEIYAQYGSQWFSICLRYQKSRDNAMDVLQDSLIKIYSQLSKFQADKGNFGAWTNRIIVNENLMAFRKDSKHLPLINLESTHNNSYIEAEALQNLSTKDLMRLILEMPLGYSTVFNLYVIEGYNHKEIAEKLNIKEGTSKSQLYKAKQMIRKKIEAIDKYQVA